MQLLGKIGLLFGIYKTEMIWYNENKKAWRAKMKEIKELRFEEMTTRQKLGFVHTPLYHLNSCSEESVEYVLELIKNRSIGAIWIQWFDKEDRAEIVKEHIKRVRDAADYPILIVTDLEDGIGEFQVGQHNAIGCTGSEEHAYAFGKCVGTRARELGYDMVCNPILDIKRDGWSRSYGSDKKEIARLAAAEARGMHDAGILTMGKHYPSGENDLGIDSHMAEPVSEQTEEELIDYSLYAYIELMKEGLLDAVMSAHHRFPKIDPNAPASLSKPVLDIIRRQGFDGIIMTDALCMMGIRAKYGRTECMGLALAAGNDTPLYYGHEPIIDQESIYECYDRGLFTDDDLDRAVKHLLEAQHKAYVYRNSELSPLTEREIELAKSINEDSVCAISDFETPTLPRDGKFYFALMARNEVPPSDNGAVAVDTFTNGWHYPKTIADRIKELFPSSEVLMFHEYPNASQILRILNRSVDSDGVIFLTFSECLAYTGEEHLTHRVISTINAMQYTNRVKALIHFGNPKVLEPLSHIPRIILGGVSKESTLACVDVLAGVREPKGVMTYEVALK